MANRYGLLTLLAVTSGLAFVGYPQAGAAEPPGGQASAPAVQPATDGVFAGFRTHPLVGIGDAHGLAQEQDFYAAIVRDPRFAREVGNVVVEFGGAAHQGIVDRYVNGEDVPYSELRKVWSDTVGWVPYPGYAGFLNFYAQVRATNATLPPDQRIKVWLGEPPIDWSKVTTRAELQPFSDQRDTHAADVIIKNVLKRNRKALVIYGTSHFNRERPKGFTLRARPLAGSEVALRTLLTDAREGKVDPAITSPTIYQALQAGIGGLKNELGPWGPIQSMTFRQAEPYGIGDVYEIRFANETKVVNVLLDDAGRVNGFSFRGSGQRMLVDVLESTWPEAFYIIAPYEGLAGRSCEKDFEKTMSNWPKPAMISPVRTTTLPQSATSSGCDLDYSILYADAMLFVGPGPDLVTAPRDQDFIMDAAFRAEMGRRYQIMTGRPLGPVNVTAYAATPSGYNRPPAP